MEDCIREFEIGEGEVRPTLHIVQKTIGDVGCVVWDAALVLAKYLERLCSEEKDFLRGKKVLELGAGTGLVGLVAAYFGGDVTLTDLPEMFPLLGENVRRNALICEGRATSKVLIWGWDLGQSKNEIPRPDIILVSDCIYYAESVDPLIETLLEFSDSETLILMSYETRMEFEKHAQLERDFFDKMKKSFHETEIPKDELHPEFTSDDIRVLRFKKR
ncbi:unnamed protein product [Darwinula stevensoni]|uniref:Protein-lysine methyltransferase METTL21D n=1 Tax=Darwinula stevensoni TaxID=69355 RepID=A0A7R8XEB0_9CRUS|nr:unnamed protein product [Darwinula stevensoni]CAG0889402.1 unnamed protein product [Darwinula stevensoni]